MSEESAEMMERLRDEFWEESWLFDHAKTGDVILVPMRVTRKKKEEIGLSYMHPETKSGIIQTAPAAFYYLQHAQATCSMCAHFRRFQESPGEGYCDAGEGKINEYRETCCNFKGKD